MLLVIPLPIPCPALSPWAALLVKDNLFNSMSCTMSLALACSLGTALIGDKIDCFGVRSSVCHFENCHQTRFSASLASYGFVVHCWHPTVTTVSFLLVTTSLPVLSNLHHILYSFPCVHTCPPFHPPGILPDPSGILYLFGLACSLVWLCLARSFVCAGWDLEIKEGRWLLSSFWSVSSNVTLIWGLLYSAVDFSWKIYGLASLSLLFLCQIWLKLTRDSEDIAAISGGQMGTRLSLVSFLWVARLTRSESHRKVAKEVSLYSCLWEEWYRALWFSGLFTLSLQDLLNASAETTSLLLCSFDLSSSWKLLTGCQVSERWCMGAVESFLNYIWKWLGHYLGYRGPQERSRILNAQIFLLGFWHAGPPRLALTLPLSSSM